MHRKPTLIRRAAASVLAGVLVILGALTAAVSVALDRLDTTPGADR